MIRKAVKADAKLIATLAVQMWDSHSVDELAQEFSELTNSEQAAIFLMYDSEQAVGFAQCQLRHDYVEGTATSPVGYLEGIFIKDGFRRRGYAKQLLAECEKWASKQGCTEFASDCELSNTASLNFHMALGFDEANRIICFTKRI